MSIGEPIPRGTEVSFPAGIQEVLRGLPDNLPVFKEGGVKTTQYILDLDKGKFPQDQNGFTGNTEIDQFLVQVATMGFVDRIYQTSRSLRQRFNPYAAKLPAWLIAPYHYAARFQARPLKDKDLEAVVAKWVSYGERIGKRGESAHGKAGEGVEWVFNFSQFQNPTEDVALRIIDRVSGNAKIYVDGAEMLKWDNIEAFLNSLKQQDFHPDAGKINTSAQKLVFYYDAPIKDVNQVLADAKENGLNIRGPAQDMIPIKVFSDGRFTIDFSGDMSNDSTLDYRSWEHTYKQVRGYDQTAFFSAYIDQLKTFFKNPACPYLLTTVRVNWEQATPETQRTIGFLKEKIKAQAGLDTFVPRWHSA